MERKSVLEMNKDFTQALEKEIKEYKLQRGYVKKPKEIGLESRPSLKEISIRYCLANKIGLRLLPRDLRISVNSRRYVSSLCVMLDPFKHRFPYYDIYSSLSIVGDIHLERKSEVRLHLASLELFGIKDLFYDDTRITDLRTDRERKNLFTYIYFKYHLDELAFTERRKIQRKRNIEFDITNVLIGQMLLYLDDRLVKLVRNFE